MRLILLGLLLVAAPAVFFYSALFGNLVDMPCADDYEVLIFINRLRDLHGIAAKAFYVLTAQQNEYKLILGHTIFTIQYLLLGRVSFAGLAIVGDLSIVFLILALWKMFLPAEATLPRRLALFVPVSWLLFQLSYAETLNWPLPGIQNLYVFVFSFATFIFGARKERYAFPGSILFMVLAISASANGFVAAFVGGLILLRTRQIARLLVWTAVTTGMIAVYALRYIPTPQSPVRDLSMTAGLYLKSAYLLSFLGSVGEIAHIVPHLKSLWGSIALGILLCAFFASAVLRRKLSANPAVNAAILFLFLTALGVARIRSGLGPLQSLSSRYRIYSSLLLIFAWFLYTENHLLSAPQPLIRNWRYLTGCIFAIVLSVLVDVPGYHFLLKRNDVLVEGMARYEHPIPSDPLLGPVFVDHQHFLNFWPQFNTMARELLARSAASGVYRPPRY